MKGNEKLVTILNQRLADELTAVNQYMINAEMCNNWNYGILQKDIEKLAIEEMYHAEWLIEHIIFLGGAPAVSKGNPKKIGRTILAMVSNNLDSELIGLFECNAAIKFALEVADESSADLLTKILKMEELHVDWTKKQQALIEQMGIKNYLTNQVERMAS
jgi:bacterioferritin